MRHAIYAKATIAAGLLLTACASDTKKAPDAPHKPDFASFVSTSCPDNTPFVMPEKIALDVQQIGWGHDADARLSPLTPVAVYKLESSNPRFGGLSGLDFLDHNTLLAVSDQGEMVWIDIEDTMPVSSAYMAMLRGADGQPLEGKKEADSEGVAWNGEYAFVSFERDHRILGYDIEGCGGNARGIEVVGFAADGFGIGGAIKENSGLESVAIFGDGLITGLETRVKGGAVLAQIAPDTDIKFNFVLPVPDFTELVGLEVIDEADGSGRLYALSRSYDPVRGNRNGIIISDVSPGGVVSSPKVTVLFDKSITIDNFEAIAVQQIDDGTDRIYILSDNNFSDRQQTLLGVMDYHYGE